MSFHRVNDTRGNTVPNSYAAVNNIYLNGLRIATLVPTGEVTYHLTDQVDSVRVVVNEQGKPVSRTEFLPYGETWYQEGNENFAPKYNSQELDKESGLYFYNARYYDAEAGRFVTPDSIIDGEYDTQGWNRYSYVKGNPVGFGDPSGNSSVVAAGEQNSQLIDLFFANRQGGGEKISKDNFNSDNIKASKNITMELQRQNNLSDRVGKKNGCNYSSTMTVLSGMSNKTIDQVEYAPKAIESGAMTEKYYLADPDKLANIVGVNKRYKAFDVDSKTTMNIKSQIDKGNPVKLKLSDSHFEVVSGYEVNKQDNIRFKIKDPGNQGDTYLDSKTMKPYRVVGGKKDHSTEKGYEIKHRTVKSYGYFE